MNPRWGFMDPSSPRSGFHEIETSWANSKQHPGGFFNGGKDIFYENGGFASNGVMMCGRTLKR